MSALTHELHDSLVPNRALHRPALLVLGLGQVAALLALWMSAGSAVLPNPREVLGALGRLWTEAGLGPALAASAMTSLEAVALSAMIALPLAWLTVLPALRPLVALLAKARFLGLAGLTFVFMLLTGGGHALKLCVLVFGMGVFLLTGMADAVASIPRARLEHARALGMGPWRAAFEVVVLGTADQALDLVRQNAAMGWTMVTLVEGLYRAEGGAGALLLDMNKHLHLAEVFAIQLCILGIGLVQDAGLAALRRALCPWTTLRTEEG